MRDLRGKIIAGKYIIIGAALCCMLASGAQAAELTAKDKLKQPKGSVIGAANPIPASVDHFTGNAVTPGFKSVGTAASLSIGAGTHLILSNPSPATVLPTAPAVSISSPASVLLINYALAFSGGIQTIPPAVKPVALPQPQIQPDSTFLSLYTASDLCRAPDHSLSKPLKCPD